MRSRLLLGLAAAVRIRHRGPDGLGDVRPSAAGRPGGEPEREGARERRVHRLLAGARSASAEFLAGLPKRVRAGRALAALLRQRREARDRLPLRLLDVTYTTRRGRTRFFKALKGLATPAPTARPSRTPTTSRTARATSARTTSSTRRASRSG